MNLNMRSMKIVLVVFAVFLFTSCNNVSREDKVVAKVGKNVIYMSEVEYMLKSIPIQQKNMLGEKAALKKAFEQVVDQKILAHAGHKYIGESKDIVTKLEKTAQRDLSRLYQQQFIIEGFGYTDNELRVYYNNHKDEFKTYTEKDTSLLSYSDARNQVATKLKISDSEKELRALYKSKKSMFDKDELVRLSYIQLDNEAVAKSAEAKVLAGVNFDSLALNISVDRSAKRSGDLGWIEKGQWRNEISTIDGIDKLLFGKDRALKEGQVSKILPFQRKISSTITKPYFAILKVTGYKKAVPSTYEMVKDGLIKEFLQKDREGMLAQGAKPLYAKYGVEISELPKPDAKKYYEDNKDNYKTTKGYKLYQIEMSDSAALVAERTKITDLNSFKAIAAEKSENIALKSKSGDLGVIKQGHCLPYGIGMAPNLFPKLNKMKDGSLTDILYIRDSKKFNLFFLEKTVLPVVKPFDRVESSIIVKLSTTDVQEVLDPKYVLVTKFGKPFIYQKDVDELLEEVPPRQRNGFTRTRLIDFLVNWDLMSREAKELNIDQSSEYLSLSRLRTADAWANEFKTRFFQKNYALPKSVLEKTIAENKEIFGKKSYEESEARAAVLSLTLDEDFEKAFEDNKIRYRVKKGETWKDYKTKIFTEKFSNFREKAALKRLAQLEEDASVKILDSRFEPEDMTEAQMTEARKLFDARKSDKALELLNVIATNTDASDEYRAEAYMKISQLYMEKQNYKLATKFFKHLYISYPKYKDSYKAMFMEGFIYYEHTKEDAKAKDVFKQMMIQYPNTDLSDDAKALYEDLESGRQNMKKIIEKATKQIESNYNK